MDIQYFAWRFMQRVRTGDGCWIATNRPASNGYVNITIRGVEMTAHRWSWLINYGPIPDGMEVCHKCDVRNCCRPDHLFLGTRSDNMRDMWAKGRGTKVNAGSINRAKTHCPQGHEYTEANTWRGKNSYRQCRTCHRDKQRERERRISRIASEGRSESSRAAELRESALANSA